MKRARELASLALTLTGAALVVAGVHVARAAARIG